MRKLIAAINMTLDGFCDHAVMIAEKEEVLELKRQAGKNILVGSPSLIVALTQLELIDEYQLCVQPVVLGSGLPLFKNVKDRVNLKLLKTKTFGCGAVNLYYVLLK